MKKVLFVLVAFFLFACSKKDVDPPAPKTRITVTNNTDYNFEAVKIAYLDFDANESQLLRSIGNLLSTEVSTQFDVNDSIREVYAFFDYGFPSKTYIAVDPYPVIKGAENSVIISNSTDVAEIEKTSILYPK